MKKTVCYFGNFDPKFGRNRIRIEGFKRRGFNVIECVDNSGKFLKYIKLFIKHWKVKDKYDFIIIGYPSRIPVIFAKLISSKPVILDAVCSLYEIVVISRKQFKAGSFKAFMYKMVDWISVRVADLTFVEIENQRKYFIDFFGANPDKIFRNYIGVDDSIFYFDPNIKKFGKFTAVFRGQFLPEAGIQYIVEAAKILENENINFLLMGGGHFEDKIKKIIKKISPKNLKLIPGFLSFSDLRKNMLMSHVSLGQFEDHERLIRTIPNKAFESLSMRLPYITARADGVMEVFKDGENCLMVHPANSKDISEKILKLKNDNVLYEKLEVNGYDLYKEKFTPEILVTEMVEIIKNKFNL